MLYQEPRRTEAPSPPSEMLAQLEAEVAGFSGQVGVWAENLATGEQVEMLADEPFESASCIKVPIMIEAFAQAEAGRLSLVDRLRFERQHLVLGSGVLRELTPGLELTLRDAIALMIVISDNTATNIIIDRLGIEAINARMASLGLSRTRLWNRLDFERYDRLGTTTPREYGFLMRELALGHIVSPEASAEMVAILKRQQFNAALTRRLPYELIVPPHTEGEAPKVEIASKSGSWEGTRNDGGIVYAPGATYVVSLFSKGCRDRRFHLDNEASLLLPRLHRIIFDHWVGTTDAG